jgi:hypothetical protein
MNLLNLIKIIVLVHLAIILLWVISLKIIQKAMAWKQARQARATLQLQELLLQVLEQSKSLPAQLSKHQLQACLQAIGHLDTLKHQDPAWLKLKQQITNTWLIPLATILTQKHSWKQHFLALRCLHDGSLNAPSAADEAVLITLVQSPLLLIATQAAQLIIRRPTQRSMDALLSACAQGRHLQQSWFAESMVPQLSAPQQVILNQLIHQRLENEHDPYVKIFCYHLLAHLDPSIATSPTLDQDLLSLNIDLTIAAIYFLARTQAQTAVETLTDYQKHPKFEVRAAIANALGSLKNYTSIPCLLNLIHDQEWWVRINAAKGLALLGTEGIKALQSIQAADDAFAYETAQQVLTTELITQEPKF